MPLLMPLMDAVITTKLMMDAAAGMPISLNTRTNELPTPDSWSYGHMANITNVAPM